MARVSQERFEQIRGRWSRVRFHRDSGEEPVLILDPNAAETMDLLDYGERLTEELRQIRECPDCLGDGFVDCSGLWDSGDTCSTCNGSGEIDPQEQIKKLRARISKPKRSSKGKKR